MEKEKKEVTNSSEDITPLTESDSTESKAGLSDLSEEANKILDKKIGIFSVKNIVCTVFAILVVVLLFVFLFGDKKGGLPDYPLLFQNEDGDLMIVGKKGDAVKVASLDDDDEMNIVYSNTSAKYVLYIKNENLYIVNATKKGDATKIASDIDEFGFSNDDKFVYYLNEDGDLYSYNMKESTKLDSDVDYIVAVLEDKIVYEKEDVLYIRSYREKTDDREKIAEDYGSVLVSKDEKEILYSKYDDDATDLYIYNIKKKESNKIASNVEDVLKYNDDFSKIYYTVEGDSDSDIDINDSMKKSDESFEEVDYFQQWLDDIISYDEYREKDDAQDDILQGIEERNRIREYLEDFGISTYKVMLYNGKDSKEVVKTASDVIYVNIDDNQVAYTKTELSGSITIDETYNGTDKTYYDFTKELEGKYETNTYIMNGNKEILLVDESASGVAINGKYVYYTIEDDKNSEYELFYGKLKSDSVDEIKSIDDGLIDYEFVDLFNDGRLYYFADEKDDSADLKYVKNGKVESVASDVYFDGITLNVDRDKFYFLADYGKKSGTLYVLSGSKVKKLANDVHSFIHINDDYMYILKDYNSNDDTCDLYRFNGKKEVKISEDIISTSETSIEYLKFDKMLQNGLGI